MTDQAINQILIIVGLGLLAGMVVFANVARSRPALRILLQLFFLLLNGLFVLFLGVFPYLSAAYPARTDVKPLPMANAVTALVGASIIGGLASLVLLKAVRQRIARIFPPLTDGHGFDPDSTVHMAAIILCLYLWGNTALNFVLSGGLSGLAEDFAAPTTGELWLQMGIFLLFALLGTGFLMRRRIIPTLERLGLRGPTTIEILIAVFAAFLLFVAQLMIGQIWAIFTPQDVFEKQTQVSRLLNQSVGTLSMAFLLSITAAVGEEIAFRGALQPIFGLWPTSIFFALTHIQYTLTPASLIIVVVGVGLGVLRRRYNTTTAILAHFLYDFAPLALYILASATAPSVLK